MTPLNPEECLILVVDDIPQNLQIIAEMLERAGYETTFATSGQQALDRVRSAQPDLILLDLMMPGMNGLEVCEVLKSEPELCEIPVIFLTASNEQEDLVQAFKKGAADYITKPFRSEEVLIRIETQLTNQKLKQALEDQNLRLKQEIEVRCRTEQALKQAKNAAETANRAKSTFLANMSHELRTPLNAILGFTQLMSHSTNLTPEQQKNLMTIRRSGEHLLNLINDILDLSKIEAGRLAVSETDFNLVEMLLELEEMFRFKAQQKGLILDVFLAPNVPHMINTDRLKLRQILINLLGNAIKFTKAGRVRLRVSCSNDEEKIIPLCFEVSDTGVGMSVNEMKNLFQPFVQTQAGVASAEGTGLGLAISHKYIELLGGEIRVNSQLGMGTTFNFQVKVTVIEDTKKQCSLPLRRVISLAPNQPKYRILVVDDKLSNRQFLVQILCGVGFEVQEAANGLEAVERWENFNPHLIWMDMRMPISDGYEATKQIKRSLNGKSTVIIALTASVFEEERSAMLSAGCDDIVCKPIQESVIFEKISQYLPVCYICEEVASIGLSNFDPMQNLLALQALPQSLAVQLEESAIALDEEELYLIIEKIATTDTNLASTLKAYVDNFEIPKILQLMQAIKSGAMTKNQLSPEWVAKMTHAFRCGDLDLMQSLISQLSSENDILAQFLRNYLYNFDYQKMLDLIERI